MSTGRTKLALALADGPRPRRRSGDRVNQAPCQFTDLAQKRWQCRAAGHDDAFGRSGR